MGEPVLREDVEDRIGKHTSPTGDGAVCLHCVPGVAVSFRGWQSSIRDLGKCILQSYSWVFTLHENLDSIRYKSEIKMRVRPWNSRNLTERFKNISTTFWNQDCWEKYQ